MANVSLQDIVFPGISNVYKVPAVDNTLTVAGATADAKKTGDEIGAIKNDLSDGTMTVNKAENADQLTATVGIEDNAPYLFRTSGGSNDIGDREDVRKIIGGTIVNNQLIENNDLGNPYPSGATATYNPTTQVTSYSGTMSENGYGYVSKHMGIVKNHVYLSRFNIVGQNITYVWGKPDGQGTTPPIKTYENGGMFEFVQKSTRTSGTSLSLCGFSAPNGTSVTADISEVNIIDLTQMFGTVIANYVYDIETATAGAGVAWLKKHFPAQFNSGYQAYDAGSLQSVSGLTEHRMTSFNQWDEEWEVGGINHSTGGNISVSTVIRSKNYIPCLPSTAYYFANLSNAGSPYVHYYDADKHFLSYAEVTRNTVFATPTNAHYIRFNMGTGYGATYKNDICINLSWDGERDGEYEAYKEYTYPLDDSLTLRGIPKLDSGNNLYYDGDEYLPDGTINRRYGVVDLGTLTWSKTDGTVTKFSSTELRDTIKKPLSTEKANVITVGYTVVTQSSTWDIEKTIAITTTGDVYFMDSSFTSAQDFKTAMSGVYLVYELATPTAETALPYQETQIVDDFGTEEFVLADGAFPVPVGHNTMYQNNLRAKLEMSPDSPDGDGLYVVQQESGENTYVPLASTATIQDILTRLTALENA